MSFTEVANELRNSSDYFSFYFMYNVRHPGITLGVMQHNSKHTLQLPQNQLINTVPFSVAALLVHTLKLSKMYQDLANQAV